MHLRRRGYCSSSSSSATNGLNCSCSCWDSSKNTRSRESRWLIKGRRARGERAQRAIPQLAKSGLIALIAGYCRFPGGRAQRGERGRFDCEAPKPTHSTLALSGQIVRQTQVLKDGQQAGAADWPQRFTHSWVTALFCSPWAEIAGKMVQRHRGQRCPFYLWSILKPSSAGATELNVSTYSFLMRANVQAPVCSAERRHDTSANDSPLPAGELWQRSAETPGSSALLSFFPLCAEGDWH